MEHLQWLFLDKIFPIFQIQILILPDPCSSITINPIGPWGPEPNNKIITNRTSSLRFASELPKVYSKENLRNKECPCKCLLKFEGKIWAFIKILHKFSIILA